MLNAFLHFIYNIQGKNASMFRERIHLHCGHAIRCFLNFFFCRRNPLKKELSLAVKMPASRTRIPGLDFQLLLLTPTSGQGKQLAKTIQIHNEWQDSLFVNMRSKTSYVKKWKYLFPQIFVNCK